MFSGFVIRFMPRDRAERLCSVTGGASEVVHDALEDQVEATGVRRVEDLSARGDRDFLERLGRSLAVHDREYAHLERVVGFVRSAQFALQAVQVDPRIRVLPVGQHHDGIDTTGVGTLVAEGKELREFDGTTYVMERSLVVDVALVKADVADEAGNLRFNLTARNFNPAAAMAGKICIVEVERVVPVGELAPDDIHLPGIYVHRIVHNANPEKRIEKRTVRA